MKPSCKEFTPGSTRAGSTRVLRFLAAFLGVMLAGRGGAQPASDAPRVSASAEVTIVGLDVVVTDRNGKPVHGLTASDFEVRCGGKPVVLTNFHEERNVEERVGSEAPAAPEPVQVVGMPAGPRSPRRIVVFIDRLYLPEPLRRQQVFDGLKSFLSQALAGPGDEAMVVSWGSAVRVVRSFTSDVDELGKTIDAVARRVARGDSSAMELDELAARDFWFQGVEQALDRPTRPDAGSADLSREVAALQAYSIMKAKVTALRGLIALMAGMEGRKSLVLVAHHFGRWPGREYYVGPRSGLTGFPQERDALPLLDELVTAANASGVTLYGVYPYDNVAMVSAADSAYHNPAINGGVFGQGLDAIWMNEMAGLADVTERTGGTVASHPGQLPRFLEGVAADLGSFYSLGFPAQGILKPKSVKVVVKREGLTVRTRATVSERTAEEQLRDRALANLFAPDAAARLPISVTAGEAKPSGKKFRIPLEVRIPVASLVRTPGPGATRGKFSVFVVAATPNGDFSEVTRKRQEFQVPRGDEKKAAGSHLTYQVEVESDAPAPRISLAVWDEIGGEAGFVLIGKRKG